MARRLDSAEQQAHYRRVAFATPALQETKLAIHDRFSDRPIDLHAAVVRRADIRPDAAVADVGCGTGGFLSYLADQRHAGLLVGVDVADGVFRPAAKGRRASFVAGDVLALPLQDGQFDVVCLQHMLGYVPDMPGACREASRVLRPGGGTVAATANSKHSYPHAVTYRERARELFGWPQVEVNTARFCLENMGDVLGEVFEDVQVDALAGSLRVPVADYVAWWDQMTLNWNPLPSDDERDELRARLLTEWLPADAGEDGCISEDKQVGIAWCRLSGRE